MGFIHCEFLQGAFGNTVQSSVYTVQYVFRSPADITALLYLLDVISLIRMGKSPSLIIIPLLVILIFALGKCTGSVICSAADGSSGECSPLLSDIDIEVDSSHTPSVQLAFGVMVYQKPGRDASAVLRDFHNLMEVIYTSHNHLYVLHVDIKSDPALINR